MDVISKDRSILIFNKFIEIDDLLGCNHLATSKNVKNLVVKEENVEMECYDEWTGGK